MDNENILKQKEGKLLVSNTPIIPFIEGDGIGPDVWRGTALIINSAVEKAYEGKRKIQWKETLAGEKAFNKTGDYLPQETLDILSSHLVGLKGPLTTPVGEGFRSLNVALRQTLELYACVRPVQYFTNVPSPVKNPEDIDMVIFRENLEDVYSGIEFKYGEDKTKELLNFLKNTMGVSKIKDFNDVSIGIKPTSESKSKQLIRAAIEYAMQHKRKSVTIVHKGNIMKFTEGSFRKWGYEVAEKEFGAVETEPGSTWKVIKAKHGEVIIKDVIADNFFQQALIKPKDYDVIAAMNLNGDYISDALAAQVGGIGIAPGANINYKTGHAVFEATHGTAPKYAGKNVANPSSLTLSAKLLLDHIGWTEAADLVIKGLSKAFSDLQVTSDFAREIGCKALTTDEFAKAVVDRM